MPEPDITDKYIRLRQRDPGDFVDDSFRTITLSESEGIHAVIGKLKSDPNGNTVVQSYLFEKDKWDVSKAEAWVKKHKEKDSFIIPDTRGFQRRFIPASEFRIMDEESKKPKLVGYAALFDSFSEDMWGFKEKIAHGAFTETIKRKDDVRMLFNHDPNFVIARTTNGTLTLREDNRGLYFEGIPSDTQWEKDLLIKIKRRDITQNSFGFMIDEGGQEWDKEERVRTITKVTLFDVSPVTYPAYKDTEVFVRWRFGETTIPIKPMTEDVKKEIEEFIGEEKKEPSFLLNRYGLFPGNYSAGPPDPTVAILPGNSKEANSTVLIEPDQHFIDPVKWAWVQEKIRRNTK